MSLSKQMKYVVIFSAGSGIPEYYGSLKAARKAAKQGVSDFGGVAWIYKYRETYERGGVKKW